MVDQTIRIRHASHCKTSRYLDGAAIPAERPEWMIFRGPTALSPEQAAVEAPDLHTILGLIPTGAAGDEKFFNISARRTGMAARSRCCIDDVELEQTAWLLFYGHDAVGRAAARRVAPHLAAALERFDGRTVAEVGHALPFETTKQRRERETREALDGLHRNPRDPDGEGEATERRQRAGAEAERLRQVEVDLLNVRAVARRELQETLNLPPADAERLLAALLLLFPQRAPDLARD